MDVFRAGTGQRLPGNPPLRLAVDHAEAFRRIGNGDVVGHAEFRDKRKLLEDADDTSLVGGGRRGEGDLACLHRHAALVRRHDTRHYLDERRFACAVLAEDRVDAAGIYGQLRLLEGLHAAIAFGHAFHAEERDRGL